MDKDNPKSIPLFIEQLEAGIDHIQGSRFIKGGIERNTPLSRKLALKYIHAPLIRIASKFHYTDTTNGFRAYSKKLLEDRKINLFRNIFSSYELHYYLAIRAAQLNFKCIEVPVERCYPSHGKVPTKISFLKGNFNLLKILLKAVLGKFDSKN